MEKELFSHSIVRFADCDPLGHLNNAAYLNYFLHAREDQLLEGYNLDLNEWTREAKKAWIVMTHRIAYLRPANLGEKIWVSSKAGLFKT